MKERYFKNPWVLVFMSERIIHCLMFFFQEISKPLITKPVQNYASAAAAPSGKGGTVLNNLICLLLGSMMTTTLFFIFFPDSSKLQKVENKSALGAAVPVKDFEENSSSTLGSPQSNAGVWLTKPNGKSNRKSLRLTKEDTKTETNEEQDSADNNVSMKDFVSKLYSFYEGYLLINVNFPLS